MAGTVAAGLFNAISFAGASFIFSKFSHSSYAKEMKRRDMAIEKLQQAKEEFYQKETKRRDRMEELRLKKEEASEDLHDTNKYLDSYSLELEKLENEKTNEPKLSDYYKPSKEFSSYIFAMNILLAGGVGYGVYKIIEKVYRPRFRE